jgi:hypothetical protein
MASYRTYIKPRLGHTDLGRGLSPFNAKPIDDVLNTPEEVALATAYVKRKCADADVILAALGLTS